MNNYHDAVVEIKNCATESQLLKVIQYVMANSKKMNLDESDMDRLEQIGTAKAEELYHETKNVMRNRKG